MKVRAIGRRGRIEFRISYVDNEASRMSRIELDILKVVGYLSYKLLETKDGKTLRLLREPPSSPFADYHLAAIEKILQGYCLDIEWEKSARKALHNLR